MGDASSTVERSDSVCRRSDVRTTSRPRGLPDSLQTTEAADSDSTSSIDVGTSTPTWEPYSHGANPTLTAPTLPMSSICVVEVPGTWSELFAPAQDSRQRVGTASQILRPRTCSPVGASSPRPDPPLGSPLTVKDNRVRRPSAPTSAKEGALVVHRPGFVPLPKDYWEPAVRALSSLFEDLLYRMGGSSRELDLRPESRSHASDPGPEQGQVSPKHTEGACG